VALTFDEEFDSLSLNQGSGGTWDPDYFWQSQGGYYSNGTTWVVNPGNPSTASLNPFSIDNGVLNINANRTPDGASSSVGGAPYTSGLLTTYHSFAQTYGYFELRAQFPAGKGFESDFWLLPAQGPATPELDVVELPSAWPTTTTFAIHSNEIGGNGVAGGWADVADSSSGFHTYGVDWEADKTTWYVDGKQVYQAATPANMNKPMYMIADLQVGSPDSWPGSPDGNTPLPGDLKIDYIRAYSSMPGSAATDTSTTTKAAAPAATTAAATTASASDSSANSAPAAGNTTSTSNSTADNSSSGSLSSTTLTVQDVSGTRADVPVITTGSNTFTGSLNTGVQQSVSGGTDTVSVQSRVNSETVQLGSGTQSLSFLSPHALVLTGGSGSGTVKADSGPGRNLFTPGTGSLDVTGGSDGSTYFFHANSGQMTIEDFGTLKGDAISVDQSLQGSFNSADDGQGGSMLTFGTAGSIDVRGHSGMAASDIYWV